jgi:hypothetical protein
LLLAGFLCGSLSDPEDGDDMFFWTLISTGLHSIMSQKQGLFYIALNGRMIDEWWIWKGFGRQG